MSIPNNLITRQCMQFVHLGVLLPHNTPSTVTITARLPAVLQYSTIISAPPVKPPRQNSYDLQICTSTTILKCYKYHHITKGTAAVMRCALLLEYIYFCDYPLHTPTAEGVVLQPTTTAADYFSWLQGIDEAFVDFFFFK